MQKTVYKIDDICEIKSGKRLPANCDFAEKPTDYPYIRARDIKNGKIDTDNLMYLTEDVHEKIKRYIIEKSDIVITIVGASVGDVGFADEKVHGFNLTENAVRLTKFNSEVYSKYLFYILYQKRFHDYMQLIAGASAQPKLGIYKIKRINIELPKKDLQIKIASILSQYDNLIENNNKRIKILEQMAENLYKEWFVRFRFPGHEKETLKSTTWGKIPNSFQIKKMQDVITYYIGGGWGNDDKSEMFPIEAYVIRGTDFSYVVKGDISTCPLRFHKKSNVDSRQLQENDIIIEISGGTAEQPVGRVCLVSKDLIQRLNGVVICASFCKLIRLDKARVSPVYFYYWMKYLYETRIIEKFQLQSTGIINFKFDYFLRKGEILLPSNETMKAFEKQVLPLRAKIEILAQQNQNLIKQRDLLLPRLMSGKLQVK